MNLSLSNMLSSSASGLDPDAKGYIDAVVAAGATVSGGQKSAINTFVKTGKADGWYSSLKRLYLPIWGIAAPNAICMTSLTSGTFVGGVTHSLGYVQGNGTNGYFISNGTLASIGVSATGTCGALLRSDIAANTSVYGSNSTGFTGISYGRGGLALRSVFWGGSVGTNVTHSSSESGIVSNTRASTTNHFVRVRKTSGVTALGSNSSTAAVQTLNYAQAFMCSRFENTASGFSDVQMGSWFLSQMTTTAQVDNFSANLQTLWETCTGLTLP